MSKLTLLELLQAFFWTAFGLIPSFTAYWAGFNDGENGTAKREGPSIWTVFFAILISGASMITAYIAGGK